MSSDRTLDALIQGMSTELWGQRFYEQAAARTTDEAGKRVFGALVEEEGRHLEILVGQYSAVSAGQTFVSVEEARRMALGVQPPDIFPADTGALIAPDANDVQALQMAMDFERRGHDLYASASQRAVTRGERDVWSYLARAEDQHYAFLDETLEYLKTNGTWYYDARELPFFEG